MILFETLPSVFCCHGNRGSSEPVEEKKTKLNFYNPIHQPPAHETEMNFYKNGLQAVLTTTTCPWALCFKNPYLIVNNFINLPPPCPMF